VGFELLVPKTFMKVLSTQSIYSQLVESMAVDIGDKIDALHEELMLIRARLETLEEMLTDEEASEDDKAALGEALGEHERGETISLDEAIKKLK